jgi:Bacterial PH domain
MKSREWFLFGTLILVVVIGLLIGIITDDDEKSVGQYLSDVFATPSKVVHEALGPGESLITWRRPAFSAYVWREKRLAAQTTGAGLLCLIFAFMFGPFSAPALLAFLVFDGHILFMFYRRLEDWYTLYVFTDQRVLHLQGVFERDAASIEWPRVVDFSWQQAFLGRLLGFATLRMDSASERAGFKELRDIPSRYTINRLIVEQLAKHDHG